MHINNEECYMTIPTIKISLRLISNILFSLSMVLALSSAGYAVNEIETYQKTKLQKLDSAVRWKNVQRSHDWVCTNKNKNSGFAFSSGSDYNREKCACKTCDGVCPGSTGLVSGVS